MDHDISCSLSPSMDFENTYQQTSVRGNHNGNHNSEGNVTSLAAYLPVQPSHQTKPCQTQCNHISGGIITSLAAYLPVPARSPHKCTNQTVVIIITIALVFEQSSSLFKMNHNDPESLSYSTAFTHAYQPHCHYIHCNHINV